MKIFSKLHDFLTKSRELFENIKVLVLLITVISAVFFGGVESFYSVQNFLQGNLLEEDLPEENVSVITLELEKRLLEKELELKDERQQKEHLMQDFEKTELERNSENMRMHAEELQHQLDERNMEEEFRPSFRIFENEQIPEEEMPQEAFIDEFVR